MRRNKVIELISRYQVHEFGWKFQDQRNHFVFIVNPKTRRAELIKNIVALESFLKANYPLIGEAKVEQDLPEVQPDRFKLNFKPEVKNES